MSYRKTLMFFSILFMVGSVVSGLLNDEETWGQPVYLCIGVFCMGVLTICEALDKNS